MKIIGKKLNLRESMVKGLQDEILLLGDRIELNNLAIEYDGRRSEDFETGL